MPNSQKMYKSTLRHYRKASSSTEEKSFQVISGETDLWITASIATAQDLPERMLERVKSLRLELNNWISFEPIFATSLIPLGHHKNAPEIVKRMSKGARLAGVGPMASVAGVIAQMIAEEFHSESSDLIVENGGDIYIYSQKKRNIGLLPDPENNIMLGLALPENAFPLAICSSSSTIGHSISFGRGELATVIARDASLADAAATAFCNELKSAEDIEKVLGKAKKMRNYGINGVFLQCSGQVGVWGNLELVAIAG